MLNKFENNRCADVLYRDKGTGVQLSVHTLCVAGDETEQQVREFLEPKWQDREIIEVDFFTVDDTGKPDSKRRFVDDSWLPIYESFRTAN